MTINVVTYEQPKALFTDNYIRLNNTIHICATSNMAEAISEIVKDNKIHSYVTSMSKFNKEILYNWFSDETILTQYLELASFLDSLSPENVNTLQSYKRNKAELLDTLRLLKFINIKEKVLRDIISSNVFSEKESLLPEVYSWFVGLNNNDTLEIKSNTKDNLVKSIEKKGKLKFKQEPTIIFHGFYFITPEQQKIMELVKSLGFNITFLQFYKEGYPQTFNFIKQFINEKYGWPNQKEWETLKNRSINTLGDRFSALFESNKIEANEFHKITRFEFDNFIDFLGHIEKADFINDEVIMSTNSKYMNDRMQEFYPEKYGGIRNFSKYPIGYLLIQLHSMWNSETKNIEADNKLILKMLSTRYFFSNEKEELYLSIYKELSPFFINCRTKKEWNEQLDKLFNIRLLIEENFHKASSKIDMYHAGFELDVNESPFSYISYLSISSDNILNIKSKINDVFNLVERLFSNNEDNVNLRRHFDVLIQIVTRTGAGDNGYMLELDKDQAMLNDLINKLMAEINITEVNKDYLYEAISFYLGGSENKDKEPLVEPLVNIDGELFRNRLIHVTGLDEKGLPYGEYTLPWPLSEPILEKLSIDNKYIELLLHRNQSVKQMTRYLLHLMFMQAEKIEISHIKNYQDNHELKKSFYIDLMEDYIINNRIVTKFKNNGSQVRTENDDNFDISDYSLDKKAEFVDYPNRLLYSKASKQTTYSSEYQQQFIVSRIANLLLQNNKKEIVSEFLLDIFPQFSKLTIELAIENAENFVSGFRKNFNKKYQGISDYRQPFLFPASSWTKKEKEGSIPRMYAEATKIGIIQNDDFYKGNLTKDYIYPYKDIEYPSFYEEDNSDESDD